MKIMKMRNASDMAKMFQGYGLTTAQILYHMPDHPAFLQTFIWQHFDMAPKYPALHDFLDFWAKELDGPLHSVTFTHRTLIAPNEWRNLSGEIALH